MRFELFIALRYLFSRKGGQKLISITTALSILGVTLSVGTLITVMGIMSGFTADLRDKLISVTSQAVILNRMEPMRETAELLAAITGTPGVLDAAPISYSELMLSSPLGVKGVMLRGIDPAKGPKVLPALNKIVAGSVKDLQDPDGLPGIVIGAALARHLGLDVGSRVNLLAPAGKRSAVGMSPNILPFRVVAVFSVGYGEYDSSIAFANLNAARKISGLPDNFIHAVQITVDDIYRAEQICRDIINKIGGSYTYETWMSLNANLFAALKLEKLAMSIILILVIGVSCFSIITALVMLVMEKSRDIAILISMGATTKNIRHIFMLQGCIIGLIGTALGYLCGLSFCFLLSKYQFIKLPPSVYSLDYVPVLLEWPDLFLTGACALGLCFLATLYPARQAASTEPVTVLRAE